jgi:hypothetical protein
MMVRKTAKHKANAALLKAGGNRGNSLVQKTVMPQIGMRIKRYRSKKDNAWFAHRVRRLHRNFKRRIIERPLCPLHPVDNALAVRIRIALSPDSDARVRA